MPGAEGRRQMSPGKRPAHVLKLLRTDRIEETTQVEGEHVLDPAPCSALAHGQWVCSAGDR